MKKYLLILPIIMFLMTATTTLNAAAGDGYVLNISVAYINESNQIVNFTNQDIPNELKFNLQLTEGDGTEYQLLGNFSITYNDITDFETQVSNGGDNYDYIGTYDTINQNYDLDFSNTIYNNLNRDYYVQLVYQVKTDNTLFLAGYNQGYTQGLIDGANSVELESVVVSTDNENITVNLTNNETDTLSTPYSEIKNYEVEQADNFNLTAFIPQLLALTFGFFFTIFSVEVIGISLLGWLALIMSFVVIYVVFRILFK